MNEELRVHGVSGTPPRNILYADPVPYDLSNTQTKVYGPQLETEGYSIRAFNWGSLTSGHWSTAFWVLLAPFAFANVAGWMIEAGKRTKSTVSIVRLAGLALTGLLAVQAAVIFSDIGSNYVHAQGWENWIALAGMWIEIALFVVLVLRFSVQSHFRFISARRRWGLLFGGANSIETEVKAKPAPGLDADYRATDPMSWSDPAVDATLVSESMWKRHSVLHRLRRAHLAFAISIAGVPLALMTGFWAGLYLMWPIFIVLYVARMSYEPDDGWAMSYGPVVSVVINAILTAHLAVSGFDLPFAEEIFIWTAGGIAAFILVTLVLTTRAGLVAVGTLVLAVVLGAAFGTTGAVVAANWVDADDDFLGSTGLMVVFWMVGALITVLLAFGISLLKARSAGEPAESQVDTADGPRNKGFLELLRIFTGRPTTLFRTVAVYGVVAAIVGLAILQLRNTDTELDLGFAVLGAGDLATLLIASYALVAVGFVSWALIRYRMTLLGIAVLVAFAGYLALTEFAPLPSIEIWGLTFGLDTIDGIAVTVIVLGPAYLLFRSIFSGLLDRERRRTGLGILWDVGSLWPRWFHPFGPPAYGPAAVTGLNDAIGDCRTSVEARRTSPGPDGDQPPDDQLVVAAHSQGAIVSVVAMGQMEAEEFRVEDDRVVSLLTYGNPAGHLYAKLFPDVGIDALYEDVAGKVKGWCNLYRPSDPIGGEPAPVVQVNGLSYPSNVEVTLREDGTGHSSYELTSAYRAARSAVLTGSSCQAPQSG